ncbi:hypothetical protein CQ10_31265 [Bradyrhizobium valentinum]|nr:hypothetical protein CQ10_31265 [Bradyrhizobium valentinum]
MRRLGELCTGLSNGGFRLRDHRFGTFYRGTEFIAFPGISRMAIVERPIVGVSRACDQLTKRGNGFGQQHYIVRAIGRVTSADRCSIRVVG